MQYQLLCVISNKILFTQEPRSCQRVLAEIGASLFIDIYIYIYTHMKGEVLRFGISKIGSDKLIY